MWGLSEVKVSIKTKNHAEAMRRAAVEHTDFLDKAARLRQLLNGEALSPARLQEEAKDILFSRRIHPQQIPTAKGVKLDEFFERQKEYINQYLDVVSTPVAYDRDGTIRSEFDTDPTNPYHEAYEVLKGKSPQSIVPTIKEAAEKYLAINAKDSNRKPDSQKKYDQRVWRAIEALGKPDALITDFNRLRARRHKEALEKSNPSWKTATLNKTIGVLSAVFNLTIREYELSMMNPWAGLKDEVIDQEESRRSFTPEELTSYVKGLAKLNNEARLIGLLMVHTGCRTMEVAGLTYGELQLQHNTPHLQLRPNQIRTLKNKQSKRDVPLIDEALDDFGPAVAPVAAAPVAQLDDDEIPF